MINFDKIFKESRTDKYTHKYGPIYNLILNSIINNIENPKLLEIGVRSGSSILSWAKSGCFSKIVGVDVNNIIKPEMISKIDSMSDYSFIEGNAYNDNMISEILNQYGKFDIIIDDGSHRLNHQTFFLDKYVHLLNTEGVLICEDVKSDNIESFKSLKEMDLYIIDLRLNREENENKHDDDILIIRTKKEVAKDH